MSEVKRWYCPGHGESKDKPCLIYPAAGWYYLKNRRGYAAPGWLVVHPGDPVTGPGRGAGYYRRNEAGQLVLAWAQEYDVLEIEPIRREILVRSGHGTVQVVQYMDNVARLLDGFNVLEWQDPRPEPCLASDVVVRAITDWEAIQSWREVTGSVAVR